MAGYTDLTVYVGGPDVDLDKLRESIRTHLDVEKQDLDPDFGMTEYVKDLSDELSQSGDYLSGHLLDLNSDDIDLVVRVLNQAIAGDSNAYWRCAIRQHDDFDAEWWDSDGRSEPWDPFDDLTRTHKQTIVNLSDEIYNPQPKDPSIMSGTVKIRHLANKFLRAINEMNYHTSNLLNLNEDDAFQLLDELTRAGWTIEGPAERFVAERHPTLSGAWVVRDTKIFGLLHNQIVALFRKTHPHCREAAEAEARCLNDN